jgi:hypothetical protein
MASPLQKAESALQNLFETKLGSFSRSSLVTTLAEIAIAEMRDLTRNESGSLRFAPDQFVIHANTKTWKRLNRDPQWMEKLKQALEKEARDSGITFQSALRIDPVTDEKMEGNDFSVECNWQADTLHHTKTLKQSDVLPNDLPRDTNRVLLIVGGKEFILDRPVINLGRRETNDLVIDDKRVSRSHAQIRITEGSATIYDLDSTGGTFVNNNRVRSLGLKPGDVISLAGYLLIFNRENDLSRTDKVAASSEGAVDSR